MFKFFLKHKILSILGIFVICGILLVIFVLGKEEKAEYATATVERGDLVQTVSETGTVKATSEINLNFLNTGKVAKILVKVGDKVIKDEILAELDYSSLVIKEKEAQAELNKLLAGASPEEIAVSEANAEQAKVAYSAAIKELENTRKRVAEDIAQAKKELNNLILSTNNDITSYEQDINNKKESALATIDAKLAVVNTALDKIDRIINDDDAKDVLGVKNAVYLNRTVESYNNALDLLSTANDILFLAKSNKIKANIDQALSEALKVLNEAFVALNNCYTTLENSMTTSEFNLTELDSFKTDISAQLTAISTAISAVRTDQQEWEDAVLDYDTAVDDAQDALATAEVSGEESITIAENKVDTTAEAWRVTKAKLAESKAPARSYDITLAQANLDTVKNQIQDSIIKAPIDGTITKIEYEIGEQTLATQPAISILGENSLEIEVDISEADIAKININDPADITIDAFGDDTEFLGKVYFIEPAETVIQEVIYYKVKIQFQKNDENLIKLRSGMTANIVITTAQKNNVLIMPSRAVVQKNGGAKIVRVLVNSIIQEMPVVTGMRGDEGMVEVLSGVKEGDTVVTYIKKP